MCKSMCLLARSVAGLSLLILSFLTADVCAQSKVSKKAEKRLSVAVTAYMSRDVQGALEAVNSAIAVQSNYADAWMLRSQLYEERRDWSEAAISLEQGLLSNPRLRRKWHAKWIELLFKSGDYSTALAQLDEGDSWEGWSLNDSLMEASIRFANHAIEHPSPINLHELPGSLNTPAPEYYPALFASGDRMIFTRQLGGDARLTGQEDFFLAEKQADGRWNVIRDLSEINTRGNEGAPTVRGDGRRLVFTACEALNGGYGRRSGEGSCDLFQADFSVEQGRYVNEVNVVDVNSRAWESQPSLSSDGHWLFFVRAYHTASDKVVQDIYQSEYLGNGEWSRPSRLSKAINTAGKEENPVLHADGKTLYFASDGHPGMGGMDLYVSRMQPDGTWSEAVNLGYPINSSGDENSLQVFPDGRTALFATDREHAGDLDLWQFTLPESGAADEITLWRGEVIESASGLPVSAVVQVLNPEGENIGQQTSDAEDGQFTLSFPANQPVILQVEQPGYVFFSKSYDATVALDAFVQIPLDELQIGSVFILKDVRFDRSSAALDTLFQPDLEQLARTLLTSDLRIRIVGHTDGEGSAQTNQQLSEERARSVVKYLHSLGISMDRMESQGMGERSPIETNETPEGRARNRRTEIEVID